MKETAGGSREWTGLIVVIERITSKSIEAAGLQ